MDYWAESMLLWSAQILLLVAMLLAAAALLRRSSAAERYRLWLVGLFAIAALPVAGMVIAALPVASPVVESVRYITPAPEDAATLPDRSSPPPLIQPSGPPEATPQSWSFPVARALFLGWVAGVLFCMVRPIRSYVESRRLRAGASIVSEPSLRLLAGHSSQVRAPMLAGILRPMVLLPADISGWARPEERHAMLLHEAAHFERRDHLANLFQTLLGAVLFFHPAVRFALRQLILERELACDEQVLNAGVRPEVYAEALLKVAERSLLAKRECEPAFHTSGSVLERRMTMISNYRDSIAGASRMWRGARVIAVVAMAVLLLPDRALTSGARLAVPMLVAGVPTSVAQPALFAEAVAAEPVPVKAVPIAAGTAVVAAQAGFRLSGTITDQSGAVVPGVMIRVINPVDGSAQTRITNEGGAYEFFPVSSLEYTFEARLPGFQTHSRPIRIQAQDAVENAVLVMATVNTSLEVSVSAPPVVPPPGRPALPVRVGGDISQPNLIFQPKPAFPPGPRDRGVQGAVRLLGVIGTDGTVTTVHLDPGYPVVDMALVQAAMESVRQWRYRPAMLNGQPVELITRITVNFSMN